MIDSTHFGEITISGNAYGHDVVVKSDGMVEKRKKKLSKAVHGTSHILSLEELQSIFEKNVNTIVFGTGQHGILKLSPEARQFLEEKNIPYHVAPTPEAVKIFNQLPSPKTGLFHVTC